MPYTPGGRGEIGFVLSVVVARHWRFVLGHWLGIRTWPLVIGTPNGFVLHVVVARHRSFVLGHWLGVRVWPLVIGRRVGFVL